MSGLRIVNIAMRALQFFWILLTMALVGNMLSISSGPSVINYDMFTAVWCMLSLLYLIPATFTDSIAFHWAIPVTLDALNVLFTFCAAVATAAYLGVTSCDNYDYVRSNIVTAGSTQRCREGQASTAFLWFAWASFMVTVVTTAISGRQGGITHTRTARRGPAMSQV